MTYIRDAVLVTGYDAAVLAAGCRALLDSGWFAANLPEAERDRALQLTRDLERAAERALAASVDGRRKGAQTEAVPTFQEQLSASEVAGILGVTGHRVRQLARAGRIGRKTRAGWRFTQADVHLELEARNLATSRRSVERRSA